MAVYTTLIVILVILIMIGIFMFFRHRARNKALKDKYGHVPSHTELYFEEFFEDMIDSWDLVRQDEAQQWAENMDDRLSNLSERVESLKTKKRDIDQELDIVENRIERFETEERR